MQPPRRYPVGAQAALERRRALEQRTGGTPSAPDAGYGSPRAVRGAAAVGSAGYGPPRAVRGPAASGAGDRYGPAPRGPREPAGDTRRGEPRGPHGRDAGPDPFGEPPGRAARARGPMVDPAPGRSWSGDDSYGDDAYRDDRHLDVEDSYGDDYDDYSDAELDELPKRRGCRRALIALAVVVLMAMVAGWFAWSWVQGEVDPSGDPGETVLVDIPEGTSTSGVGDLLADAGVITNATLWDWYTKLNDPGTIKAGRYELQLDMSFDEAIDGLKAEPLPPEVAGFVTVPPGLTEAQIAARLADPDEGVPGATPEAVQAALVDPATRSAYLPAEAPNLEGTLYPETYAVEEGETAGSFILRMVHQFDQVATEVDLNGRAAALGMTPYQVLIVASMIEREAGTVEDGPRVARVIYNRMAAGEALRDRCHELLRARRDPVRDHHRRARGQHAVRHPQPDRACPRARSPRPGGRASRPR